jgi:chromosome segregation ATPase
MATESVDIILSAKDNATAVLRKTSAEMKLLQDRVQQTGDQTKLSGDSLQKLANLMGAGWLGEAAFGMKELSDGAAQAAKALQSGGPAALAMKAGLVGLVAYGSFAVGNMIGNWLFETDKFKKELEEQTELAKKLGDQIANQRKQQVTDLLAELRQFGGSFQEQKKVAEERLAQLRLELSNQEALVAIGDERSEQAKVALSATKEMISALEAEYGAFATRVEQQKESQKNEEAVRRARVDLIKQEIAEEEKAKQLVASKAEQLKDQILQLQTSAEEYELIKIAEMATSDAEKQRLETLVKQRNELQRQREEADKLAKQQEDAARKQQQEQVKLSQQRIKQVEKYISELEAFRIDVSRPTLSGRDERITSQARGSGDLAQQQVRLTQVQVELQRAQKKLAELMERHLNVIANQEDPVVNLVGA